MLNNSLFVEINKTDSKRNIWSIKIYQKICEYFEKNNPSLKFGIDNNQNIFVFDNKENKLLINPESLDKYYLSSNSPNMNYDISANYAVKYLTEIITKWDTESK